MNTATMSPMMQSVSMRDFKTGVDEPLSKRSYFISQVLPRLVEGQDYYVIKGRKSLAKGGSEKIASIYGFTARFEQDTESMKAFEGVKGMIAFICNLYKNEHLVGQGRGASTLAKNDNDPNKTLKMATKSSYIDSVIRTSGLSDIFTQDLETMNLDAITEIPKQEYPSYEEAEPVQDAITPKQKSLLIALLFQKVFDEDVRDGWLASLETMTKSDASEAIKGWI